MATGMPKAGMTIRRTTLILLFINSLIFASCQVNSDSNSNINLSSSVPPVDDIYSVEFCDLVRGPKQYDGKRIRVSATLITGREYSYLYDPKCIGDDNSSKFFVMDDYASTYSDRKLAPFETPENPEFLRVGLWRVQADFIGRFEVKRGTGFGHMNFFDYKLEITDTQNERYAPANIPYPWPSPKI